MRKPDNDYTVTSLWTYPNGVLMNKFNIQDQNQLAEVERGIVNLKLSMLEMNPLTGYFDCRHLQEIHRFLFGDIYDFAGCIRNENISKGKTVFCDLKFISAFTDNLFYQMYNERILSKEDLIRVLAYYYAELNMIHPFREGNGRASRAFFRLYAASQGYNLSYEGINKDRALYATIYSVYRDSSKLEEIFRDCIKKNEDVSRKK